MAATDWQAENPALIQTLTDRLGGKGSCLDLIRAFEGITSSIWTFIARLLGAAGTQAVMARSVKLAASGAPLLERVQVREGAVDFSEFRDHAVEGCNPAEVLDALLRLGIVIFQTLSELSGDAVTRPLLSHLQEQA